MPPQLKKNIHKIELDNTIIQGLKIKEKKFENLNFISILLKSLNKSLKG